MKEKTDESKTHSLHDHRNQPDSLPRRASIENSSRRSNATLYLESPIIHPFHSLPISEQPENNESNSQKKIKVSFSNTVSVRPSDLLRNTEIPEHAVEDDEEDENFSNTTSHKYNDINANSSINNTFSKNNNDTKDSLVDFPVLNSSIKNKSTKTERSTSQSYSAHKDSSFDLDTASSKVFSPRLNATRTSRGEADFSSSLPEGMMFKDHPWSKESRPSSEEGSQHLSSSRNSLDKDSLLQVHREANKKFSKPVEEKPTPDLKGFTFRKGSFSTKNNTYSTRRRRLSSFEGGEKVSLEKTTSATSLPSNASRESRANSDEDTEEDVCFPMDFEHKRINGIDYTEMEEFIQESKLNAKPKTATSFKLSSPNMFPYKINSPNLASYKLSSPDIPAYKLSSPHISPLSATDTNNKSNPKSTRSSDFFSKNKSYTDSSSGSPSDSCFMKKESDLDSTHNFHSEIELENFNNHDPNRIGNINFRDLEERFSYFNSEADETIQGPDFPSLLQDGLTLQNMFQPEEHGSWWLDCMCPTDAEMRMLQKAFGIHPLTAEDIRVQETREKVELFKTYYFVAFHTFHFNVAEDEMEPINVYMVVFRSGILSFHFAPIRHTANVRKRIRQLRDYVNVSADWICYALIDDITDGFAPVIHDIETEAEGIEDSVFVARPSDHSMMLLRIGDARKHIMSLMRLLSGKADVIKMFAKRCNEQWGMAPKGDIGLYLGDIHDHVTTMYQNLVAYEKILSRSHANYLAQVQLESLKANSRVTELFSKVTVIGTIIVPMNLITGLWGMNVKVPGDGQDTFGWFFGIVGVLALLIGGSYLAARQWLWGSISTTDSSENSVSSEMLSEYQAYRQRRARFYNDSDPEYLRRSSLATNVYTRPRSSSSSVDETGSNTNSHNNGIPHSHQDSKFGRMLARGGESNLERK